MNCPYRAEYSKSSRASCKSCCLQIAKDVLRLGILVQSQQFDGKIHEWYHFDCFFLIECPESENDIDHFESLRNEDKKKIKAKIAKFGSAFKGEKGDAESNLFDSMNESAEEKITEHLAIKQEEPPIKKLKSEEDTVDGKADDKLEKQLEKQSDAMFEYRDQLKELTRKELYMLLEANEQQIPNGKEEALDRLSDIMTFGALVPCEDCSGGQYVFTKAGYECQGDKTEWTKCKKIVKEPKRKEFHVPPEFAKEYSFLNKYKCQIGVRMFKEVPNFRLALFDMEFVIIGKDLSKENIEKKIVKLGGKLVTKLQSTVMAVISNEEEVEKMGSKMCEAREADIQVVPESFLKQAEKNTEKIPELIMKMNICSWGTDPASRLLAESSNESILKSESWKVILNLNGNIDVDPDSGLENEAHVYQSGSDIYNAELRLTDIQKGKNSYYKLQLLEADEGEKYWIFRAWGRIGTTFGGNKLDRFGSLHEAKREFKALFMKKTGNAWGDSFVKVPEKKYLIDLNYGQDEAKLNVNEEIPSKLPEQVQDLIKMIFDINNMKKTMLVFKLDLEKMPLGKLCKKQIQSAFEILSELQKLVENGATDHDFIDASNRFYTFIPHSFGVNDPTIINSADLIKQKLDMLDTLMEIEIAYSLLKMSGSGTGIDAHYETLKTDIDVLDKSSEEFKIIEEYVRNTQAPTHSIFELEILNVFTIKRQGEEERYKPFKNLHNRKLLWHGSRLTNYSGILSQGLRIAPPEAPPCGYMFGKGIYFADMVSKSAQYCDTDITNPTGLMLLCEVALGEMHECKKADYIENLPEGKHSCKGLGMTHPDPNGAKELKDVEVPCGEPVEVNGLKSRLLYNEYIVYNVAQVKIKYLVQMNFKYDYMC